MQGGLHGDPAEWLGGNKPERDKLGRYRPGYNSRTAKQLRIMRKHEQLRDEFFPCGGWSAMDDNRMALAASHFIDAEMCRDPVTRQRATRCAEYLLSKLTRPAAPPVPSLKELGL